MGRRVRALALVAVLLAVGALLGSALSQWWPLPGEGAGRPGGSAAVSGAAPGSPAGERVRVEVLNGGGRPNMARRATDHLRDRGFDVVYYGNADTFDQRATVVLDRVGRPELARAVAGAMGGAEVRSEPDSTRFVDVSVVLGSEWDPPPEGGPSPAPAARSAWWDLRRFLPEKKTSPPGGPPSGHMADPGNEGG